MELVTPEQMREIDRATIEDVGIPGIVLMERAALGAVEHLLESAFVSVGRVGIVCGGGNNGGDGFAMARLLADRGVDPTVFLLKEPPAGDAAINLQICRQLQFSIVDLTSADGPEAIAKLAEIDADVWVDAIFGTGLDRPVEGRYRDVIEWLDAQMSVFGVDVPSGIDSATGQVLGIAPRCFATATFGLPKVGQALEPARSLCGHLRVIDIGVPETVLRKVGTRATWLHSSRFALPPRPANMHKGEAGRVVVVGGEPGTTGAAIMCARGAMKAGAGLVTVVCPAASIGAVHATIPQAMAYDWADPVSSIIGTADVIVCGPGMGRGEIAREILREVLDLEAIVILDADALNIVAEDPEDWAIDARTAATIITPHPGEASRLLDEPASELLANSLYAAQRLSETYRAHAVFKSSAATLASADGLLAVNASGNPGMATGGMGDALAGIVAGRACEHEDPFEALCEAVFAHGMAADLAVERVGERALSVDDLLESVGAVWRLWETR